MIDHITSIFLAMMAGDLPFSDVLVLLVTNVLPWCLSCITIYMTLLVGNHNPRGWLFGLVNQALWLVWIIGTSTWGLIPLNIVLWGMYFRNHVKWVREARAPA